MPLWFFTSDLHGHPPLYEHVLAAVAARLPAAVLIGGDLAPHEGGANSLVRQRAFFEGPLVEFARRLREASPATELLLLMGNDDWAANLDCLERHDGALWRALHGRAVVVHGTPVAGLSWVPITPLSRKDWERWDDGADETPGALEGWVSRGGSVEPHRFDPERRSPTIAEAIDALAAQSPPRETVFVFHSPPRDTNCDLTHRRMHVGSRAIRSFVERHQPPLVLSGHIHESPRISSSYRDAIGRTVVVNPGQFGSARLNGVWFDPERVAETLRHSVFG